MIKGINKNVIEVSEVGSAYYEKAILFIKPQFAEMNQEILELEAKNFLRNIDAMSSIKSKKRIKEKIMVGLCLVAVVATLCLIFLF